MSKADRGGHPFHGEEKGVGGPAKSVKSCGAIVGLAYSQDIFDHNASDIFVVTEGPVAAQEPSVYPGVDAINRSLFCLFGQEDFEPNLSRYTINTVERLRRDGSLPYSLGAGAGSRNWLATPFT